MASSNWNKLLDLLLGVRLTASEYRVALAVARLTLGYGKPAGRHVGRKWIRETAGNMDGRSFARALTGLISKGVLSYQPGSLGRGNRGHYALVLDTPEKAAVTRPFETPQKAAVARPKAGNPKGRAGGTKKAAPARPRRGKGRLRTPQNDLPPTLVARTFDAYRDHGGNLTLADRKPALVGQVTQLAHAGYDEQLILAAAAQLGRERAFPGYLKQRADQLIAEGGPCQWRDFDRSQLAVPQLRDCGCLKCEEWATATATPAPVPSGSSRSKGS